MDFLAALAFPGWVHTEAEIRQRIGQAVKKRRQELNKAQEQVAFEASINTTYLSDVERGKRNIAAVNIVRLAAALDMTASELFQLADL